MGEIGAAIIVGIVIAILAMVGHQKQIDAARKDYEEALEELKDSPDDPDLRQEVLRLGRIYANVARRAAGSGGRTVFDEVALSNDIAAATAGGRRKRRRRDDDEPTVEDRLRKLKKLRDRGEISDDEYERRREKMLDEI